MQADKAELRELTDVRTLRALTHPVRIALTEALTLHGHLTATQAGELIGESPTTCSFHLRQLAKYGFVEEAGGGKGRARPWRLTSKGITIPDRDELDERIAASALTGLLRERQLARHQTWIEHQRAYPKAWRSAAFDNQGLLYLTAEELAQLGEELLELVLTRYAERMDNPSARPDGALPVEVLMFAHPVEQPAVAEQ